MKCTIIWSFRNRINQFIDSLVSADKTCPKEVDFCLVDGASDEKTIQKVRLALCLMENRTVRVCESAYRTTVVEAWNLGMMLTQNRYVIFASSDVRFIPGWYEEIVDEFNKGFEYVIPGNHAVFGFDKNAILKTGWFDEGFHNGPHVDCDFMIRASENKVKTTILEPSKFIKHDPDGVSYGERTRKEFKDKMPMNDPYNERYFKAKWKTSWPGWENVKGDEMPHPPTTIREVVRMQPETDPHPFYTEKLKCIA